MPATTPQRVTLITGGAGFIGSHLVGWLLNRGDRVVVIDDCSTGSPANLEGMDGSRLTLRRGRVSELLPQHTPGEFDEIYHLAAAVGVRLVIEQPVHTIQTNILETSAVLEFAAAEQTPILIASTSEVYGKSTRVPFREDDDVVYGSTACPRWSYACSKAIDEFLALAYHRTSALPVVVARFFNIVGPRQVGEYGMVIPRMVDAAIAGQPIEVYGDGRQTRCFCDVRDVVELLPRLLVAPACHGGVFNVGSDQAIEIRALAELVKRTLGSDSPIVLVSYEEAFGPGFDDLRHRQPDLSRLRSVLPFTPGIDLAQTIRDLAAQRAGQVQPLSPVREAS